jgi:hypothetical protein
MRILDAKSTDCYVVTLEVNGDELAEIRHGRVPLGSTQEPLSPSQAPDVGLEVTDMSRRWLFALWGEAFPKYGDVIRHDFTQQVLGEHVSWSNLTWDQFQRLRDALNGAKLARDYLT